MGSFLSTSKDDGGSNNNITNPRSNVKVPPPPGDEDFYQYYRKEAITRSRSASNHFEDAKKATARGDHLSAKISKRKAHEEQIASKQLHAEAAKDISDFKNCKNNQWTLDLHGLHVEEAVQAVQERLQKIESDNRLNTTQSTSIFARFLVTLSNLSVTFQSLNVITGKGNHSNGEAKLPAPIRSFLQTNGYKYDDNATSSGIIIVYPNFR